MADTRDLILLVLAVILAMGLMALFPQFGLMIMGVMNQIRNWIKILLYSIMSTATGGASSYF
jgi:hypothetical protein